MVLSKLDDMGKLAWLAVILVAFWAAWPVGLAVLAYLIGSGRLRGWREAAPGERFAAPGRWFNLRDEFPGAARRRPAARSGNEAFDAYRDETLRRLEDEQREFQDYLERLRRARDKAEFDGFMAERGRKAPGSASAGSASAGSTNPTDAEAA